MNRNGARHPALMAGSAPDSLALACLSAAIVCYQIVLMQMLANAAWYHFAYLVISFALLGFGLSGTLLSIRRIGKRLADRGNLTVLAAISATSMVGAVALTRTETFQIDLYGIFSDSSTWVGPVTMQCLLLIPFTSGALVIAAILLRNPARAGFTYGVNLSASALGALIAPLLLNLLPAHQALVAPALLAAIGSLATIRLAETHGRLGVSLILAIGAALAIRPHPPSISPYKDISRIMALPGAMVLETIPSTHGLYQRVQSPALRLSTPLDLNYPGSLPNVQVVLVNGDTVLSDIQIDAGIQSLWSHGPEGVLTEWLRDGPIWLLAPETTLPIRAWIDQESADITVIAPHPQVAAFLARSFDGADSIATEPRAFLETTHPKAALIRFPSPGSSFGSVGLGALSEQPLFTAEAIATAWSHLKEGGILVATAPIDHPLRTAPRLLNTLSAGLSLAGEPEPTDSLLGLRTWSTLTLFARRGGFSPEEISIIQSFSQIRGFDLMAPTGYALEPAIPFHSFADPSELERLQRNFDRTETRESTDDLFRLSAPTDNRPYFSQFIRISRIPDLLQTIDLHGLAYLELGLPIVIITLVQLSILGSILILFPWLNRRNLRAPVRTTVCTFGCAAGLGLGFILAEIGLIQRAVFLTGNPVAAAAAVLAIVLLTAGVGSWWGQRHPHLISSPARPAAFLALLFALLAPVAGRWLEPTPILDPIVFIAAAATAGFVMGMPFPGLIAHLGQTHSDLLPWAWGVNGFLSVIGAPVAALLSVTQGTLTVFLVTAAAYGIAGICGNLLTRSTGTIGERPRSPRIRLIHIDHTAPPSRD